MRIAMYFRTATPDSGGSSSTSLATQRLVCDAIALQHGWEIVEHYVDDGIAGCRLDRPALRQLLADAQSHRFDGVMVYRLDRLSRRLDHLVTIVQQLDQNHIHLVSVEEQAGWDVLRDDALARLGVGEGAVLPHVVLQARVMRRRSCAQ